MVCSNFGHSLRECFHHFRRNWATVLGAVVTIFLSLFLIGVFVVGSVLVDSMLGSVEDQVTIQAFLSDDADQDVVDAFMEELLTWDNVETVTYKSKEEALEEYSSSMSNKNAADAVAALDGENPLPASIVITLDDPSLVESTAERIVADETFLQICDDADNPEGDVQYGSETVERLFSFTTYLRYALVALVVMLVFVAFIFINNTIRLSISARSREIAIMRLVGASNGYIRGPFVMEGTLEALVGALLAIAVLWVGVDTLLPAMSSSLSFLSFSISDQTLYLTYAGLLLIGVVIGWLGSQIAMTRYLKV